jgi:tetratricopeptide (TPR) repeat protein
MKCLAVQQPWAWAICAGFKRVENRTWQTPYRGPVAVVASGKKAPGTRAVASFSGDLPADTLAYGAVIGTAELTDVVPLSAAVEGDPHACGPFCWVFDRPQLFQTPVPTTARLRLYDPKPEEAGRIAAEAARPRRALVDGVYAAFARSIEPDAYDRGTVHGEFYWEQGALADLSRVADRLLRLDPSRPEAYLYRAEVAFGAERFADALVDYDWAVGIDPGWAQAYTARSDAHNAMGNTAAAEADFAKALELDPTLADEGGPVGEDEE